MCTVDFGYAETRWWWHCSSWRPTEPPACSPRLGRWAGAEEKRSGSCVLNVIDERRVVVVIRDKILVENAEHLPVAADLVLTRPRQLLEVQ